MDRVGAILMVAGQACGRDEGGGNRRGAGGRSLGGKGSKGRPWSCLLLLACFSCFGVAVSSLFLLACACVREKRDRERKEKRRKEKKEKRRKGKRYGKFSKLENFQKNKR
jgi:hypothetical protein